MVYITYNIYVRIGYAPTDGAAESAKAMAPRWIASKTLFVFTAGAMLIFFCRFKFR